MRLVVIAAVAAIASRGIVPEVIADAAPAAKPRPRIATLAPADDARRAIPIGPSGEVYAPDGKGEWVRRQPVTTAASLSAATRAGGAAIAIGDGVLFRLAANGWSAIRLVQHGKAVLSAGNRGIAASGKTLYALDRTNHGEPVKIAEAASPIVAIGGGAKPLVLTDRGLVRLDGAKLVIVKAQVPPHLRLVSDRFGLVDRGAIDLVTAKVTPWPAGVTVAIAAPGPGTSLAAVGVSRSGVELLILDAGKIERDPIAIESPSTVVGVALDRAKRATVAFSDGRIALRERGAWTVTTVREELPVAHPGSPPAVSP